MQRALTQATGISAKLKHKIFASSLHFVNKPFSSFLLCCHRSQASTLLFSLKFIKVRSYRLRKSLSNHQTHHNCILNCHRFPVLTAPSHHASPEASLSTQRWLLPRLPALWALSMCPSAQLSPTPSWEMATALAHRSPFLIQGATIRDSQQRQLRKSQIASYNSALLRRSTIPTPGGFYRGKVSLGCSTSMLTLNRFRPTRSPAVPEADLNTSKLADAFPGFSGIAEDAKPFSPNPFTTKATGHNLKMPSRVKPFQSRVRDENDVSIATETHSSPAKSSSKNSRFGNSHRQKTRLGPQPHVYRPATGLVQNAAALTVAGEPKSMAINPQGSLTSLPNASTQPTLNLPQTTHLTDLFSGVVRHPPPHVAQQTTRPRASRFASATKTHTAVEPKADALHVPADERHLLESIDVLQDRVAELEKIKAQLETTNTNLDQKNFELQIEKREFAARRRSDSGVSISDNASHDSKGQTAVHHRMATENKRRSFKFWTLGYVS